MPQAARVIAESERSCNETPESFLHMEVKVWHNSHPPAPASHRQFLAKHYALSFSDSHTVWC